MDISSMTLTELKALAYDQFLLLQATQNNIRILEDRIKMLENSSMQIVNEELE